MFVVHQWFATCDNSVNSQSLLLLDCLPYQETTCCLALNSRKFWSAETGDIAPIHCNFMFSIQSLSQPFANSFVARHIIALRLSSAFPSLLLCRLASLRSIYWIDSLLEHLLTLRKWKNSLRPIWRGKCVIIYRHCWQHLHIPFKVDPPDFC